MHPSEQRLAIEIAERLLIIIRKQSAKNARTFAQFFAEQGESVGLDLDLPEESDGWEAPDRPDFLDECREAVRKRLAELADAKPGDLARRLVLVARVFGLSDDERDILGLIYRVQFDEVFEELFDRCHAAMRWDDKRIHRVAAALGITRRRVAEALDEDGRLVRCGLAVANQQAVTGPHRVARYGC